MRTNKSSTPLVFPTNESVNKIYDAYLLDLDGTVLLGNNLITGAETTISALKSLGKRVIFISNNSTSSAASYAKKLTSLGIPTENEDIVNSTMVLIKFLNENIPKARLLVIGELDLCNELKENGFDVTDSESNVDAVIASFDRNFKYEKLQAAFDAIENGARFFATNADKYRPIENSAEPDAGAIIAAIEACTGKMCEVNVGKPSHHTVDYIKSKFIDLNDKLIIVGDRPETDVQMAINASVDSALVLSGATNEKNILNVQIKPTYVINSVIDLLPDNILNELKNN
tara:strand:- start:81 stop:938 length:858 start_codon:yes stop_codon:yes gene_type:complete